MRTWTSSSQGIFTERADNFLVTLPTASIFFPSNFAQSLSRRICGLTIWHSLISCWNFCTSIFFSKIRFLIFNTLSHTPNILPWKLFKNHIGKFTTRPSVTVQMKSIFWFAGANLRRSFHKKNKSERYIKMSVISVSFFNLSLVSISCHVNLSIVFLFFFKSLYLFNT